MALAHAIASAAFASCAFVALIGCLYLLFAAVVVWRIARFAPGESVTAPAVTILKPLHGAEPGLQRRLLSFCDQTYSGDLQIVCGVRDGMDPAIDVAKTIASVRPSLDFEIVVDERLHGSNRKVANLMHCFAQARHDIIVLADSDIEVDANYLSRIVAALQQPGVGAVTCLYEGEGERIGAKLSAQAINAHFLPNVVAGMALGAATPCCGSTIALRRETLERIGGLRAVADKLADDYAIGAAVRRLGLTVAVPAFTVRHACGERSIADFLVHQLRFARTIRSIDPRGHAGSAVTNPLPFALAAVLGHVAMAWWILAACLACRTVLLTTVARRFAMARQHLLVAPICDLALFAIYVASFCGSTVEWRGQRFRSRSDGTLAPTKDPTPA